MKYGYGRDCYGREKKKFNHAFTLGFSVESDDPRGADIPTSVITEALLFRIANLIECDEMYEAIGLPFDTYENEEVGT
ncbi:MAG: hypothetical protein V3V08_07260 [Nannocystaceae bacterium]